MGKNLSIATISLLLVLASTNAQQVFDVKSYGAKPNVDITHVKICECNQLYLIDMKSVFQLT